MAEDLILGLTILFGGAAVAVLILRALMLRFLPDRLAGPGGFLIDTAGKKGFFQTYVPSDHLPSGADGSATDCD